MYELGTRHLYRITQLYLPKKLALWETQLPGYDKGRISPIPSFLGASLWAHNLCGPIFVAEVLKLSDLSVLSDIETSGPTLMQVLLVQMSERGLKILECFGAHFSGSA